MTNASWFQQKLPLGCSFSWTTVVDPETPEKGRGEETWHVLLWLFFLLEKRGSWTPPPSRIRYARLQNYFVDLTVKEIQCTREWKKMNKNINFNTHIYESSKHKNGEGGKFLFYTWRLSFKIPPLHMKVSVKWKKKLRGILLISKRIYDTHLYDPKWYCKQRRS